MGLLSQRMPEFSAALNNYCYWEIPENEVDTLELMLSLLRSINSIALLPKIMTDKENGLSEFRDFPPEPLTTHIYCSNNKNFLLIRDILHTFC